MKKYLLDTHVILWWLDDDPKLSDAARQAMGDPTNTILASSVSGYEIAWKSHLGKLDVPFQSPADFSQAGQFTSPHRDPFDRQLAAQATCEDATIITIDPTFATFPGLTTLW